MTTTPTGIDSAPAKNSCAWLTVDDSATGQTSTAVIELARDASGTWTLALYDPDAYGRDHREPFATLGVPVDLDAPTLLAQLLAALPWRALAT